MFFVSVLEWCSIGCKECFLICGDVSCLDMCAFFYVFVDAVADVFSYLVNGGYEWCSGRCFLFLFAVFLLMFSLILVQWRMFLFIFFVFC